MALTAACRGSTEVAEEPGPPPNTPCPPAACLLVTNLQSSRTAVIDPTTERFLGLTGPQLSARPPAVLSADSLRVIMAGYSGEDFLVTAMDVRTGEVRWQTPRGGRVAPPGVTYYALGVVVASPDERSYYGYPVQLNGISRLGRFAVAGGPVEVVSELATHSRLAVFQGRGAIPAGTVALVTSRSPGEAPFALFFADAALAVLDSIVLPATASDRVSDLLVTPDERVAYVLIPPRLFRVDLAARAVTHEAPSQRGVLAVGPAGPAGGRVYVGDPGGFDLFPATGILSEYAADLATRRDFVLPVVADSLSPLPVWHVAVTGDGRRAFLLTGTATRSGPLRELASVDVLDLVTGEVTNRIRLADYPGPSRLFLFEPTPP